MCGRFYIDDDLKDELDGMLKELNQKIKEAALLRKGDIFPTNYSAAFSQNMTQIKIMKWGYPGWNDNKVIFNARSETALQKRMFENGFMNHRCLIPVTGFYEWDQSKIRYYFKQKGERVMYLGAIMDHLQGEDCFTILTREADEVMKPVHSRMPVVVEQGEADRWLRSLDDAKKIVGRTQPVLVKELSERPEKKASQDYEQLHIFNTFEM